MRDDGVIEIKDFNYDPTPKRFRLYRGGDVLEAAPEIPLDAMATAGRLAREAKNLATDDPTKAIDMILVFFREILLPESVNTLAQMQANPTRPISARMLMDAFAWLMESYGLRPTVPSSDSSSISPDDGSTSSMAGAPHTELTRGDSPSTSSSTSSTGISTNAEVDS